MFCRTYNKNKNNKNYSIYFRIVSLVLLVLVSLVYVWQVNKASTQGYYLKDLERKISILKEENEKFNLEVAELSALPRIDKEVGRLGLVKSDVILYLNNSLEVVARNQ